MLLDGLLATENTYLTERQRRIYEAVISINKGRLTPAFLEKEDNISIVANISQHSGYWASREKVFEAVNKEGGKALSLSIVNNELVELMDMGLIDRSKPTKSRHFGYYAMTLDLGKAITLPDPSDITEPSYKGEPVEVINPLTGETEKI